MDAAIQVNDEDSIRTAHQLLRKESIFVGSSSGCIAAAAVQFCDELEGEGKNVVMILADGGRGYMSTIYDESWLSDRLSVKSPSSLV